jgi:hypothetical protein
MMALDPFTIASGLSLATSAGLRVFGPDPEAQQREALAQRMGLLQELFGRRGEFFSEQMAAFEPQLAFADTQTRLAAREGARRAQAAIRRRMGGAGDVFGGALQAGAMTGAAGQQNTLRALATTEALRAADRTIGQRANVFGAQPLPQFTGQHQAGMADLFAQIGTSLGYLGTRQDGTKTQTPTTRPGAGGVPLAGAANPAPQIGPRLPDGSFF